MKFIKEIARPGVFYPTVPGNPGQRRQENIPAVRVRKWFDNLRKMVSLGIKIPAPWWHDPKALAAPASALPDYLKDSRNNGGFWDEFKLEPDGRVFGTLDVPDQVVVGKNTDGSAIMGPNPDLPKIGASVQEVSPLVMPWQDGMGNNYDEAVTHIALVTHAIQPGQENFKPASHIDPPAFTAAGIAASAFAFSMSEYQGCPKEFLPDPATWLTSPETIAFGTGSPSPTNRPGQPASKVGNATNPTVKDVLTALQQVGLVLPQDTTPENLMERIMVASQAVAGSKDADDGTDEHETEQPAPIVMSAIVGDEPITVDPVTGVSTVTKATTPASVANPLLVTVPATTAPHPVLLFAANQAKASYTARIKALIKAGKLPQKVLDENITPLLNAFQLSADMIGADGSVKPGPLDAILTALEAMPANPLTGPSLTASPPQKRTAPKGQSATAIQFGGETFNVEQHPDDVAGAHTAVTEDNADEILAGQMEASGRHREAKVIRSRMPQTQHA